MRASTRLALCGLFTGWLLAATSAIAATSPTDTVRETVDAVIATLADDAIDDAGRRDAVMALIVARFDFEGMSRRILATNWKSADEQQKARFVELFSQILGNTYWHRIRDYSEETVEYVGEKLQDGKLARVNTMIVTATQQIPVDYSLRIDGEEWRAYDVVIEGVSLVRNYRSTYQQIVKQEGIDGLLEKMAAKVAETLGQ